MADASHDFDFLIGRWTIQNHRLVKRLAGSDEWEDFPAISEARLFLGGYGSEDEYFTDHWPGFAGHSLRIYNPRTDQWSIYWVDNRTAVLQPPVTGSITTGGIFEGPDEFDGRPIRVRFTWSEITPNSAHWEQAFSEDDGQTWETNWTMELERAAD